MFFRISQRPPGADSWLDFLTDANPARRLAAVAVLSASGGAMPGAVPALCRALGDPVTEVRRMVVVVLGELACDDPSVLPALAGALSDGDVVVRRRAAAALE
jgi:HEAT repeat protein